MSEQPITGGCQRGGARFSAPRLGRASLRHRRRCVSHQHPDRDTETWPAR